jgi:acetyl-CoA C-acetyltransferase
VHSEEGTVPEAVIVATARTPIGRAFKGSLVSARPDDMGAFVVDTVLSRTPAVARAEVDDVVMGVTNQVGEQGVNVARNIALLANLPDTVPATTVARQCASSLQAIRMAFHAVKAGDGHTIVAGGVESTTRIQGKALPEDERNPRFVDEGLANFVCDRWVPMGLTAEIVAERFGITRRRQDELAKLSQDRAVAAQKNGFFDREISPYGLPDGTVVTADDCPRPNTTLEKLAELAPAFKKPDGTVTAGNSCPLNDGAAAVLVMVEDRARALGIQPLARILASTATGVAPNMMGVGPIEAIRKALDLRNMTIADVDVVEFNEAFAAQVLAVCDEVGISVDDQLNPHGGGIALGHPFGMTGARLTTTLINDLQTLDKTIGLATMCVGGGMGMAMVVERLT